MYRSTVQAILVKLETTYGVDAAPLPAQAIRAHDATWVPLEGEELERAQAQPYMGQGDMYIVGKHATMEFSVEAAGSGTAGTAPAYDACLRMAGLSPTITAGQDVTYNVVTSGHESASIYSIIDGKRYRTYGARANVVYEIEARKVPFWKFKVTGLFVPIDAAALPAVDFSAFIKPVPAEKAHIPLCTLHGYGVKFAKLSFDVGQGVKYRGLANDESIQTSTRKGTVSIDIEEPPIGTKDYYAAAAAHVKDALVVQHGTVAGNIIRVEAPKVQLGKPKPTKVDDIEHLQMTGRLNPDAGDDEIQFIIK